MSWQPQARPRGDDLETGMDVGRMVGHADAYTHPWDWDDETIEQLVREFNERQARRRPVGFTAEWPT